MLGKGTCKIVKKGVAVKIVDQKPLSALEKTHLPGTFAGLGVTLKRFFQKPATLEYPEKKEAVPAHYRGVPTLVKDQKGRIKCVSCQLCEFVCPPKAIRIVPSEIPAEAPEAHIEKTPLKFEINMLRCIYCGLCEEVCPEQAIFLKDVYALNGLSRDELLLNKERLLELGGVEPDGIRKWGKKLADAQKAHKSQEAANT